MRVIPHAELTPGIYWASYRWDRRNKPTLGVVEVHDDWLGIPRYVSLLGAQFEVEIEMDHLRFLCRLDPPDIDPQEAWNEAA